MRSIKYVIIAIIAVFAASTVASVAHAENGKQHHKQHHKQHYSLDRAVNKVRKRQRGRVLSADTYREGGRSEYRIRMLSPEGRVRTYRVDPRSGVDID